MTNTHGSGTRSLFNSKGTRRIHVRSIAPQEGMIRELKQSIHDTDAGYSPFLSQYDRLKPDALSRLPARSLAPNGI